MGDDWGFETFPEYLDLIEQNGVGPNVGVLFGHTPIRVFVMGDDAVRREATPDEIATMKRIEREALEAGAIGFSTSQTKAHSGEKGLPVPSRWSSFEEHEGLIEVLGEFGNGTFAHNFRPHDQTHLPNFRGWQPDDAAALIERTGVRICSESVNGTRDATTVMDNTTWTSSAMCDLIETARDKGFEWTVQAGALPNTFEVSLADPFLFGLDLPKAAMRVTPLDDLFVPLMGLDRAERLAAYSDPEFRTRFRAATNQDDWNERYWPHVVVNYAPTWSEAEGQRIVALAEKRGEQPSDVMLDLVLSSELEALFGVETSWSNAPDQHEALLKRPSVILGLSDGGAHVAQVADSRFPTTVLSYWVRERGLPLEWGVWMLTKKSADAFGIQDRGTLTVGLAADICVFDAETAGNGPLQRWNDFPADARRIVSEALGIDYVIVNGTILRDHNKDVVANGTKLPGKVLREFRPHAAR
jgi:N-acyl-D-aspartate/D-glutamate deacylase